MMDWTERLVFSAMEIERLKRELAERTKEVERLRAALKPFADWWNGCLDGSADGGLTTYYGPDCHRFAVQTSHLEEAAKALAESGTEER